MLRTRLGSTGGDRRERRRGGRAAARDPLRVLEDRRITPLSAESEYIPQTPVELPEDKATEVLKMIDLLEQDDDVQRVCHNLA